MAEKTEKATPKKLKDARKKGQVAKSQDFPSVFTFLASVGMLLGLSSYIYGNLTSFISAALTAITEPDLLVVLQELYQRALYYIFITSMPLLLIVASVGVLINFLMVGPTWAVEAFKPEMKKFDPIKNLKAKFKMKTLIEIVKSMIKIGIAAYIIYSVMWKGLPVLTNGVRVPLADSVNLLFFFLVEVLTKVSIVFFFIAIADLLYQRYNFANEMKMEKFEVKQEYKNTEGDPQIKSKRREIAREVAYSAGPAAAVKHARAVVTNPTHLAIALGYERGVDPAPYILEMGEGAFAEYIIKIAKQYDIPIMRNIPLAHELYEQGEVWSFVPEDTFEALAEIMRWVATLEKETEHLEKPIK